MDNNFEVLHSLLTDEYKRLSLITYDYVTAKDDYCADAQAVIEGKLWAAWACIGNAGAALIKDQVDLFTIWMDTLTESLLVVSSFLEDDDWNDNSDPFGAVKTLQRQFRHEADLHADSQEG